MSTMTPRRQDKVLEEVLREYNLDPELILRIRNRFVARMSPRTIECSQCHMDTPPMFMLRDEIWLNITTKDDILCFYCTQKLLGRPIVWDDLKPCTLTDELRIGAEIYLNSTPKEHDSTPRLPPQNIPPAM